MNRILIFCSEASGGLADYAHAQSEALAGQSLAVTLLAPSNFIHRSNLYSLCSELQASTPPAGWPSQLRRFFFAYRLLVNSHVLQRFIERTHHKTVLWTSFTEYLAPLWAWRFRYLRRHGVCFAAVVHDPVRSFRVGPLWWHRWSIAEGYSFISHAFVHAAVELDTVRSYPDLQVTTIPHGPFSFPAPKSSRLQLRKTYDIPRDVPLFLAFGRLRTDKNLHRVIRAVAQHPGAHLLVAGPEATPGQSQSADYQRLALELGLEDRCHWRIHFHTPEQVSEVFTVADVAILAYSASFHSASGVLNIVANYGLPVIASAGDGALLNAVTRYSLGLAIPPDDTSALSSAIHLVLNKPPTADWTSYLRDHSWEANAMRVITALQLTPSHA